MKEQLEKIMFKLESIEQSLNYQKNVLTFEEACEYSGLSKSYLYKLTAAKKIPHYCPSGKLLYFNKEELEEWLLHNRVSTSDELENKAQSHCMNTRIGGE